MSLSSFFTDKCLKALDENKTMILAMISDPSSLVTADASGALVDAASGGMGSLANFAGDYLKNNADALVMEAAEALGYDDEIANALNVMYNLVAMSLMLKNDLMLMFLKKVAENAVVEIKKKDEKIALLKEKLQALYNALVLLASGDPVWNAYVEQLREALRLIAQSKTDIQLVRNTLNATDYFLGATFTAAKERLYDANKLLVPLKDNPYLEPSWQGLLLNIGAPVSTQDIAIGANQFICSSTKLKDKPPKAGDRVTIYGTASGNSVTRTVSSSSLTTIEELDDRYIVTVTADFAPGTEGTTMLAKFLEPTQTGTFATYVNDVYVSGVGPKTVTASPQMAAVMAIPVLSKEVALAGQGYLEINVTLSALLDAFMVGYDQLSTGLPKLIKKYVLSLFDSNLKRLGDLTRSMALKLNGAEEAINYSVSDFEPQPLTVSVMSYKWAMDLNLILSALKLIPEDQLAALSLSADAVNFYKNVVDQLRAMDGKAVGGAVLIQQDGKEATGSLEEQLLAFLIEANAAIVSSSVRKEILALGRSMLIRMDLSYQANREIESLLQSFIDYPLPDQTLLNQLMDGLTQLMSDLGLDNAAKLLQEGNFEDFLNLNGNTATLVGAALAMIAMLKNCFDNKTNDQLNEIEQDLAAQKDLLSINLSLNFNLAILMNLKECLKLKGYAKVFDLQQLLCKLVKQNAQVSKALETFASYVSF